MLNSILDWNKQQGYADPRDYPSNFVGPVRPGDTIGGVSPYKPADTPQVLGASTGGGDSQLAQLEKIKNSGGLNPSQKSLYDQLTSSAQSGNQSSLDAIQKRLDETRRQSHQQIDNATGTRDYLMNFINQRYPELQNRVEQQRGNALQDLGTQEHDLTTLYDRANAQSRRRSESAALQNRNVARAGNRLGSSFYDETVANNQEELGKTLGASDLERIGKVAAIGIQRTRTNQDYNNTINDLDTQKNQAAYSALDEYKKAVQQAEALDRAGVLDFGEGQAQAAQNLQSRLDSIAQWAQGMAMQQQQLSAQYGTGGGFDTGLSSLAAGNQSFINQNAATPAGNTLSSFAPTTLAAPQQATDTSYLGYGNQKPLTIEDILNGVKSGGLTFN